MKKTITAAIAALAASASAKPEISGSGSFDMSSGYVLYGARFTKDPTYWTYGELNATADGWGGVGVSLWQNSDATCRRKDTMRRMNEWDWSAYYRNKYAMAEGWAIAGEAGHIWYKYHGLKGAAARAAYKTMMEAYGKIELENPYVTPHLFAAFDHQVTQGSFATLGLKRDLALPLGFSFTPELTVGGGDDRYLACLYPQPDGKAKSGISFVQLSGRLSYWFNDHFGVHAQLAYAAIASDRIRSGIDTSGSDCRKQFAWGTVGVDFSF